MLETHLRYLPGFCGCRNYFPENNIILLVILASLSIFKSEVKAMCPTCFLDPREICYRQSYLLDLTANFRSAVVIKNMAVLNNILYYSYEPEISDPESMKIGYVKLDDPNTKGTLQNTGYPVSNFKALAVNKDLSLLYIGGATGVYIYKHGEVLRNAYKDEEISILCYKDHLYVVKEKAKMGYHELKSDGTDDGVYLQEDITNLAVAKDNEIVYLCRFGLILRRDIETFRLSVSPYYRGFATDANGVVYTWWADKIYEIDIKPDLFESKLVQVTEVAGLVAIGFDEADNMLVVVNRTLSRFERVNPILCGVSDGRREIFT